MPQTNDYVTSVFTCNVQAFDALVAYESGKGNKSRFVYHDMDFRFWSKDIRGQTRNAVIVDKACHQEFKDMPADFHRSLWWSLVTFAASTGKAADSLIRIEDLSTLTS